MLIAHDREFLDRIADRIINLEHGEVRAYRGNYSAFEEQRATELAQQQSLFTRQQREIKHMESFVERFRAKASKARQAQSRLKALERMQRIAPAHVDSAFEFSFGQPEKLPQPLLAIEDQAIGYGDNVLLSKVNFTIAPGDRIALLGRNGAGKSTLMKMLAGELSATSGKRTEARDLRVGYFAQHQLEQLSVTQSPLENLKRVGAALAARATELELRSYLGGFGFRGDRVFEPVGPFSGGEKARLVLALLAYVRPNLMLLDEPTNHLDLEMRQALAVALQDYAGAVILVSHDRHLLRTVADDLYVVGNGRVQPFDGDLEDYAQWLAESETEAKEEVAPSQSTIESAEAKRDRKREEAGRRNRLSPLKAELTKLERDLDRLTEEKGELDRSLSSPDLYATQTKEKLKQLLEAQTRNTQALQAIEAAWLEASERLEVAMKS
jgi:ATP-binding cassette subfamily F protein 3